MRTTTTTNLIGRFFFKCTSTGRIECQGKILCPIVDLPEYFLVQFFDLSDGTLLHKKVVHISDIESWKLYDSREQLDIARKNQQDKWAKK